MKNVKKTSLVSVMHLQIWLIDKKPISFWISGLSFPQGFLTGILQTCARKYNIPIDHLKFDFIAAKVVLDQEDIETEHKKAGKEVQSLQIFYST